MRLITLLFLLFTTKLSGQCISDIAAGGAFSLVLKGGKIYGAGMGFPGVFGNGSFADLPTFTQVHPDSDFVQIAAGLLHSMALKSNGTLWSCGQGSEGATSLGVWSNVNTWTFVMGNVKSVSCGSWHTLIITNDFKCFGAGMNVDGTLGIGNNANQNTPQMIDQSSNYIVQADGGAQHSIFLRAGGEVYTCGYNSSGCLGTGNLIGSNVLIKIANKCKAIMAGQYYSGVVKNDNSVWMCGSNYYGQFGVGNNVSLPYLINVSTNGKASSGSVHTMLIKTNGELWATGHGAYGELGNGAYGSINQFVQVGSNIAKVSSEMWHTLALTVNGDLLVTGSNLWNQLGTNNFQPTNTFIQIPCPQ